MKKLHFARALKVARANGYDGKDDYESVKAWFGENVRDGDGNPYEVVKTVTFTVAAEADAGEDFRIVRAGEDTQTESADGMDEDEEDEPPAKSISEAEVRRLRAKARELDAMKGTAASGVNRVKASLQVDAKVYRTLSEKKAYNARAARGETVWTDADEAEAYGAFVRSTVFGWRPYEQKRADEDILRKTGVTTTFTSTGALVPPQFISRLIDIRKDYGVIENLLYSQPMTGDTASVPRRTGGLTVYTPGEAGAITASDAAYDQVNLTARKRGVLAKISAESMNDAAFSMADLVAKEIMWSFAKDDDDRGINGDGTSQYAGDVGLRPKIKGLSGTIGDIAGLVVGAGNAYSELTLPDFEKVTGRLPAFQGATGTPEWLVHPRFFAEVMMRLALASGGVTAAEIEGKRREVFLGYPIRFSEHMPRTEANSQVCALFGWYSMAGIFGRVRSIEIATSEHSDFANDVIAIRGTQRTAITIHDVGNASGTESLREPGPVVGLITAAS